LNKEIAEVGLTYEPCPLRQNHVMIHSDNAGLFVNERPGAGTAGIIPSQLSLPENGTRFLMARDYSIYVFLQIALVLDPSTFSTYLTIFVF
jgi:hypothetical protein